MECLMTNAYSSVANCFLSTFKIQSPARNAHLVAGTVGLGQHYNATEFFSVVLVDNHFVAGLNVAGKVPIGLAGPSRATRHLTNTKPLKQASQPLAAPVFSRPDSQL